MDTENKKARTSAEVKNRYNKKTYAFYQFAVRRDSELEKELSNYVQENPQGLSKLVKSLLEQHFGI